MPFLVLPRECRISELIRIEKTRDDGSVSFAIAIWQPKNATALVRENPYAHGWYAQGPLSVDKYGVIAMTTEQATFEGWNGLQNLPDEERADLEGSACDWVLLEAKGWQQGQSRLYFNGKVAIFETDAEDASPANIASARLLAPPPRSRERAEANRLSAVRRVGARGSNQE